MLTALLCTACVLLQLKREEKDLAGRMVNTEKSYEFDHVFNPAINGSQEHVRRTLQRLQRRSTGLYSYNDICTQVFEETKGLAQSACDGFNVCIFAYGQTGSGKVILCTLVACIITNLS